MKKLITLAFILISLAGMAQVKIGDNPGTINANSLLELESTNKGFLPPRVALNDVNSVSPLSGSVTAGMLVYSTGGSLSDGYYFWNGVKWLSVASSVSMRTNYKLVQSQSDFPAPVGGVITLSANTVYELNGTITMTNKIDLNGSTIKGQDRWNDKLLYTPTSGELFTGANGGDIYNCTLSATGVGSKLFNVDAGGNSSKLLMLNFVYILNCDDIGLIKGFGGYVMFQSVGFSNNTHGIVLQDLGDFIGINEYWLGDNHNTFQKLTGTFATIVILGGKMNTLTANSAIGFDITGLTAVTSGASLKTTLFTGDGTYVTGAFSDQWEVESRGLNTDKDDLASGNLYISTPATTTFSGTSTAVKVLGTTTAVSLFRVTSPTNNRLTYTGTKSKRFEVICSLTATQAGSKVFTFYIAKNGTLLPESRQSVKLANSNDQASVTLSCTVQLGTNDYLEVWVQNDTDNTSTIIQTMNLAIK